MYDMVLKINVNLPGLAVCPRTQKDYQNCSYPLTSVGLHKQLNIHQPVLLKTVGRQVGILLI